MKRQRTWPSAFLAYSHLTVPGRSVVEDERHDETDHREPVSNSTDVDAEDALGGGGSCQEVNEVMHPCFPLRLSRRFSPRRFSWKLRLCAAAPAAGPAAVTGHVSAPPRTRRRC